jgi:hypothetical protein
MVLCSCQSRTPARKVSSDAQKALIVWRNGQETLHIKSNYTGPVSDFAWVIPIPSLPTVKRSNWSLFREAERVTRPQVTVITGYRSAGLKGLGIGCSSPPLEEQKETPPTGVRQLQTLNIRELHIDIVAATDSGGFIRWLLDHEYAVDEKAEPILQEYIHAKFYFIVTKISKSSAWAERKGLTETVSGGLTPLAITFATEKPFYPLAVSAISSAPENELLLLTAAPHRLEPLEYASSELTQEDIDKTIAPKLKVRDNRLATSSLDFAPAVRAAQARPEAPAFVVECAVAMAWRGRNYSMLVAPRSLYAGQRVILTRFHAFLKPQQMEDINFMPTERELFKGRFHIDLARRHYDEPPVSASAPVMLVGLSLAIAYHGNARTKRILKKLALIFLLVGLTLA